MQWNFLQSTEPPLSIPGLTLHPVVMQLLQQRGYTAYEDIRQFFRPDLSQLHSPFLLKDMDRAVQRLHNAVTAQQNIMVLGDYDVDGTCSVAMFSLFLHHFTSRITTYIPDRYTEGYGISYQAIDKATELQCQLIVALDCGVKSIDHINYATSKGIDFIICDHHLPGAELPQAVAVLDPKRSDCDYPYSELCGCGVGFKLIQAYYQHIGEHPEKAYAYLDFVAIAIAADIVPITGENRILAYYGLSLLNTNPRVGFKILGRRIQHPVWKISDLVFQFAPRINAAGRIHHGSLAVELLGATAEAVAEKLAHQIEEYNTNRRELDRTVAQEALDWIRLNGEENNAATVVYNPNWHKGVIGIVASRLIETYYRPTLVLTRTGDKWVGSGRSVKGIDLYQALEACQDHLIQFGGHTFAAGFSLHDNQLADFKKAFENYVDSNWQMEDRLPQITIDAHLDICQITAGFLRILHQFEPFGPSNMRPVFATTFHAADVKVMRLGADNKHLKIIFPSELSAALPAIGFNWGKLYDTIMTGQPMEMAYQIEENYFRGIYTTQLRIVDLRPMTTN